MHYHGQFCFFHFSKQIQKLTNTLEIFQKYFRYLHRLFFNFWICFDRKKKCQLPMIMYTDRYISFATRRKFSTKILKYCFFMARNASLIWKTFEKSVHTYKAVIIRKVLQFCKKLSDMIYIFGVRKRPIFKMLMKYHR